MILAQGLLTLLWSSKLGLQKSEGLIGAEKYNVRKANLYGCWLEARVPHHTSLSTEFWECPQNMASSFPLEQVTQERKSVAKMEVAASFII